MYQTNKKTITHKKGSSAYSTKKYSNPFFNSNTETKVKINIDFSPYSKVFAIVFFLVSFSFVWALFFSDYFDIKKIEINGGGKISVDEIRKYANNQLKSKRLIFFSQKNYFLFSNKQFLEFLHSKHSFEYLNIDKKYPNRLLIEFNEKPYKITWLEDDRYYYTDSEGGIIAEANLLELKERKYPLIHNQSDGKIIGNKVDVEKKYLEFISRLFDGFSEHKEEFNIEKYIIDNNPDTVKAIVVNGPEIYFNTNIDLQKQINKLLVVKREKLNHNYESIEYINLKIGDSVYYR